jgi:hypothetical protein
VVAVTLFFESVKKERANMSGTREFIGYLRRWQWSVRRVAEKVKEFANLGRILARALPELLYPLQTSRLAIHLIPATRHPEENHANCKVFRHSFRESEGFGSAAL